MSVRYISTAKHTMFLLPVSRKQQTIFIKGGGGTYIFPLLADSDSGIQSPLQSVFTFKHFAVILVVFTSPQPHAVSKFA